MAKSTIYAGLEIGTSKICVVVGEAKRDGTIKILGVGTAPSRGVRKGVCAHACAPCSSANETHCCPLQRAHTHMQPHTRGSVARGAVSAARRLRKRICAACVHSH